jgi:hypothetical protein
MLQKMQANLSLSIPEEEKEEKITIEDCKYVHSPNYLPDYVSGPFSLTEHYSAIYKKHIYIFGESHKVVIDPCKDMKKPNERVLPIHKFIHRLIYKQHCSERQTLDVFIETPKWINRVIDLYSPQSTKIRFFPSSRTPTQIQNANLFLRPGSDLNNLRTYFGHYLTLKKSQDPYRFKTVSPPMARFHYTDVRDSLYSDERAAETANIFEQFGFYFRLLVDKYTWMTWGECNDTCTMIIHLAEAILEDKNWKGKLQEFEKILKVATEVDRLSADIPFQIRNRFKMLLENAESNTFNNIKRIKTAIETLIQKIDNSGILLDINLQTPMQTIVNKIHLESFFDSLEELDAFYLIEMMDIYLMARIFKNSEFKHIIVYVGDLHATTYRDLLDEFGFKLRKSYGLRGKSKAYTKCVPIKPFEPFFKKW